MHYLALATDYDGTIAHDGRVDEDTVEALKRCRQSGRKLILVTGRELPDLENIFPHLDLFERAVVENGAVLYHPRIREKRVLAARPPDSFIEELKKRGVKGMSVGDVVVAAWRPDELKLLETIRDLGLELQVIFNKDAVMVLPAGINKMFGLRHALEEIKLSRHNVAGIGDAENDHAFLSCCGCSAAVANAIPSLKDQVDLVTKADHGAGVKEFIDRLIEDDLRSLESKGTRQLLFGRVDNRDFFVNAQGTIALLCGQSGGGKSDFVTGVIERLVASDYEVCVIDPEGDYENIEGLFVLGNEDHAASHEEILQILDKPGTSAIVDLIAVKLQDRPRYFASLFAKLHEQRLRQGRPHWVVIDEAHHLLPSEWAPAPGIVAGQMANLLLVTVHPDHLSPAMLREVNVLAIIGKEPLKIAEEFAKKAEIQTPAIPEGDLPPGQLVVWLRDSNQVIERMREISGRAEHKRRRRKYAEGELDPELVFYFRGPHDKLNLKAQNLNIFLQIAAGVDDETWLFHLHRREYSGWVLRALKDEELARDLRQVEENSSLSAAQSRQNIANAIEAKYTAPG
jgi:HAD superfamily hydrolase (TIGR01484 family)